MTNLNEFLNAYIQAALFTCNDESDDCGGDPLNYNYDESNIAPDSIEQMRVDCAAFIADNEKLLQAAYNSGVFIQGAVYDESVAGHDYWLTRCGHGAGFWDRGLGDIGEKLSEACQWQAKHGGARLLYVGDDGNLHYSEA